MPPPPPPLQPVGQRAGLLVEPDQLPQGLALDHRTGELGGGGERGGRKSAQTETTTRMKNRKRKSERGEAAGNGEMKDKQEAKQELSSAAWLRGG